MNEREKARIHCTDVEIIENLYILYEHTRLKMDGFYVSVRKVDRAVFPVPSIQQRYPLEASSKLNADNDQRRIRAVAIAVLEDAANNGHTFLPKNLMAAAIKNMNLDPTCLVTTDMVQAVEKFLMPEIFKREMKDSTEYYKLVRIQEFDDIIERRISRRLNAPELLVNAN